ncbi:hypothetical protein HMPREF8573_0603 [Streptococcus sanguinis ATCC 29667]|nr:hypothetical protein HMPREF8573_0603 [Streptococcus sanguinis ATCC 29667]
MRLEEIRQEIDQVDDAIVTLLEQRMNLVDQVVALKKLTGTAVLDSKRQDVIFARVADKVEKKTTRKLLLRPFLTF